ncbi:MAG: heme lyase CcmF/NrfE family subunit, partial [Desulfovibrionaceae bacterium]
HLLGHTGLLTALLISLLLVLWGAWCALRNRPASLVWMERAQWAVLALTTFSSLLLIMALVLRDYSNLYVYEHVDNVLPLFYVVSAFWAGQAGSLLFWGWCVVIFGAVFSRSESYRMLAPRTRIFYWLFFLTVQAFFMLLLTSWSNPFTMLSPAPADGQGLNPLLQNPAMIIHPPLLFLGYAGFTIPAAAGLAALIAAEPASWLTALRNYSIFSWVMLTAGILLGGWWSYVELGWGGYWAWDPVENASLIPWLVGTAFLHTSIIEARRGALQRTNVALIALTFLSCIFATYLVRSGVIESLHAFGEGGVALPLAVFMLAGVGATGLALWLGETGSRRSLSQFVSRQGLLVAAAWVLVALSLIVVLGTMWPVISKPFTENPVGLDAGFYNRVCLPLFTLLALMLCLCPWLGWKDGLRDRRGIIVTAVVMVGALVGLASWGMTRPLALVSAAAGIGVVATVVTLLVLSPAVRRLRVSWAAAGVHVGLGLIVLGVAFSGPYSVSKEVVLEPGQSFAIEEYHVSYEELSRIQNPEMSRVVAELQVTENGKPVGRLFPEKRFYRNSDQAFAEVSVIPGLGDELYATLLGFTKEDAVSVKVSINPLVNWIWIGGTIMCLAGLFLIQRFARRP